MAFTDFLRNHLLMANFGDWLAELAVSTGTLYYSKHGTNIGSSNVTVGSDTLTANRPYRKRLLAAPSWTQSLWAQGSLLSRSAPSYGSLLINNRDGALDSLRPIEGSTWANRSAKCFFGYGRRAAARNLSGNVGKTVDALMGRPKFSLSSVEVPLLGYESQFDQPLSQRVYRGTSYMVELSGARSIDFGTSAAAITAAGHTGSMSAEMWIWLDTWAATDRLAWGWSGQSPWGLIISSARVLKLRVYVSGVSSDVTSSITIPLLTPCHVAFSISGKDVTFYMFNDDTQTLTTSTHVNAISSATRDSVAGGVPYRMFGVAGQDVWHDEHRVWNVTRTAAEFAAHRYGEIPNGAIPSSLTHYTRMNDGTGGTVTDSSATGVNGTFIGGGTNTWLQTYEGAHELAGTPKPDLYGKRFGIRPILVNPLNNTYNIAGGGAIQAIDNIYAGGLDNYVYDGDAASLRAFLTTTPAAGHVLTYLARGLFKLGTAATLPLMVTARGYNGGSLGYVDTAAEVIRDIATRRGPTVTDPDDLDTASFTALDTATSSAVVGESFAEPVDISHAFDLFMRSAGGWWGYVRGSADLHVERYSGPAVSSDFDFNNTHIITEPREIEWDRVGEVVVRYQKSDVALDEAQVAASVKGTTGWERFTKQWLEVSLVDSTADMATARRVVFETALYEESAATALRDHLADILFGEKQAWGVSLKAVGLEVSMNDTVTLTYEMFDGTQRLGLDGTDMYIVLSVSDQRQDGRVNLEVLSV